MRKKQNLLVGLVILGILAMAFIIMIMTTRERNICA